MSKINIGDIRTDYKKATLNKEDVAENPIVQFDKWFDETIPSKVEEPNAMTLSTCIDGKPSARIVLLKGIDEKGFYFYTNYESRKGQTILKNPQVSLVFFWKELERQVRIEGIARKTTSEKSDTYYHSRPLGSQIGAWSSPQSQEIENRKVLEKRVAETEEKFKHKAIIQRPDFWGGFYITPQYVEFWQGRSNRLHDRICYQLRSENHWRISRLAP